MPEPSGIFLVGREIGDEDQLTEMLVWLCDAVPEAAAVVLGLALEDGQGEFAALELVTQHGIAQGRLDALITTADSMIVVESKLGSVYGDGQLRKYIDWLAENTDRPRRVLMSLTEHIAPWPVDDLAHAASSGVRAVVRRWEDLYDALSQLIDQPAGDFDGLGQRLVEEFLDMLNQEGLIPMKPLAGDELEDLWSKSQQVIGRFHDYFGACKEAISEALDAKPHSHRSSAQMTYVYQDFQTADGDLIGVGLNYSDEDLVLPAGDYRNAPYVWLTIDLDRPDCEAAIERLEASSPEGWRVSEERWYGRPGVWRYLDELVGNGSFAEQKARLAAVCGQGRAWLASAQP